MSNELSRDARIALTNLATAWENEDVEATFQADLTEEGIVSAKGINEAKRDALLELSARNLIRVNETGPGKLSIKLLPALNRAMDEQRIAEKEHMQRIQNHIKRQIANRF